jgi:hypothetical protein
VLGTLCLARRDIEHLEHDITPEDFEYVWRIPRKSVRAIPAVAMPFGLHLRRFVIAVYELLDDITVIPYLLRSPE